MPNSPIRLIEWARQEVALSETAREEIALCIQRWTEENQLAKAPLAFSGARGRTLEAANYVGVVEAGGHAIEIYPKLDRSLFEADDAINNANKRKSSMASLLWMLEVAQHDNAYEADTGNLETAPSSFFDLWAILLGKNLRRELQLGLARAYQPMEANSRTVRGRILFQEHLQTNFNRPDRIYCAWDEFTEDRPLNRVLKTACRFLSTRVENSEAQRLLFDCIAILNDAGDIDPATALRQAERIVWDRSMERFRLPFKLAVRLLRAIGHEAFHGGPQSYVFLLDMNQVFEDYVGAVLEREHQVPVDKQYPIGHLFKNPARLRQLPDFYWQKDGKTYVADAKYKPFFTWHADPESGDKGSRFFSIADIRQLICYGLLASPKSQDVELQVIYPFVGDGETPDVIQQRTFPGMPLKAVPIPVTRRNTAPSPPP